MKLAATVARSLQAHMQAELREIERAVASGTRDAGWGLKAEFRRQVTSAGLGQRLANSWRDKHYPNQKLDAASLVYTKAPEIIRAFDEGAVIRSRRGRFLAIPTENAPRKGTNGKRISPSTFAAKAVAEALASSEGDAIINASIETSLYGFIPIYHVFSFTCTTVQGVAIKFT